MPAVLDTEPEGATHILAADTVFFTGGAGWGWDLTQPRYVINHRSYNGNRPEYQNILYGDGHVQGLGQEYWTQDITTRTYSFWHASSGANSGGFMYWGGAGSPPAPTGNPNPAPPVVAAPVSSSPTVPVPPPPPPVQPPPLPGF